MEPAGVRRAVLPSRLGPLTAACCSAVLLAACSGDAREQEPDATVAPALPLSSAIDTLAPTLILGAAGAREEELFGEVRDIAVDPDGAIYVLDGLAYAVRVFRPGGEYIRSLGRRGEGPGEFRRPGQMAVAPDGKLWIYDELLKAVLVLQADGTEVQRFESRPSGPSGGPLSGSWDGVVDAAGRPLQSVQHAEPTGPGTGLFGVRNRTFIRRLDPTSGEVDSTFVADDLLRRYRYRSEGPGGGMGTVNGIVPFDPRRLVAIGPDGEVWTALSTAHVLTRTTAAGDTALVRVDVGDLAPGPQEHASWERLEKILPGLDPPDGRHLLWRLYVDDEGRLWIQRAESWGLSGRFDVFSPRGEVLGSVFVSDRLGGLSTVIRGGNLYAVTHNDLGVATVVRVPVPTSR